MRNYIKAELYRTFNRSYYRNFVISICILAVVLNFVFTRNPYMDNIEMLFIGILNLLNMGTFFIVFFLDIISMEEHKNGTLKNIVSSGLSRDKIVLGKIITTVIIALLALVLILASYYISGLILYSRPEPVDLGALFIGNLKILGPMVVLWIGAVAVGSFTSLIFNKGLSQTLMYFMIITVIPSTIRLIGQIVDIEFLYKFQDRLGLSYAMENLMASRNLGYNIGHSIRLGILYTVVFTGLSLIFFRKKDI